MHDSVQSVYSSGNELGHGEVAYSRTSVVVNCYLFIEFVFKS